MGVIVWGCLPLSIALAVCVAVVAIRFGSRTASVLRTISVALLLPGVALALWPVIPVSWGPVPDGVRLLLCRAVGTLPLLVLPVLAVLARMPPEQTRTAAGLGAGRSARLRLLWLPQLGPVCLVGLALAVIVDAASLHRAAAGRITASVALFAPASPS